MVAYLSSLALNNQFGLLNALGIRYGKRNEKLSEHSTMNREEC